MLVDDIHLFPAGKGKSVVRDTKYYFLYIRTWWRLGKICNICNKFCPQKYKWSFLQTNIKQETVDPPNIIH